MSGGVNGFTYDKPAVDCLPYCDLKAKLAETLTESERMLVRANEIMAEIDAHYQRLFGSPESQEDQS